MNKKIASYDDLLKEKERLHALLGAQKELIKASFDEIKAEMKPAVNAVHFLGNIGTRDNKHYILNMGANFLIDTIIKKGILARSGWISKLVLPFFIKNFSSHFLSRHIDEWTGMLAKWIEHRSNGAVAEETNKA